MSKSSHIRDIERVEPPDLWTEILAREPASFRPTPRLSRRARLATALVILVAVAGVVVPLRFFAFPRGGRPSGAPAGHRTISITEPSGSMEPTIRTGETVVVDLDAYGSNLPERGDVVVFQTGKHPGFTFIKRVIGLPGDTVEQETGGAVSVNGHTLDEPYVGAVDPKPLGPWTVERGHVFVMGDNRANSNDSRYALGQIPIQNIEGKVLLAVPPTESPSPPGPAAAISGQPRLFLAGDGEMWIVDVGTDSARHVVLPQLSPGDPPYRVVRRGDKLVVWGSTATYVLDPSADSAPSVLVQGSLVFMPSAIPDRVWVAVDSTDTGHIGAVREVTVDGRVTVPDIKPPGGRWPVAAVDEGLVFEGLDGRSLEVWDPRTGQDVRRIPGLPGMLPLAWQGHLLAWCDAQCQVGHVTDLSSGEDQIIPLPGDIAVFQPLGAFSPDGSTLALIGARDQNLEPGEVQLVLVDLQSDQAKAVPGATVTFGYNFVDWSESGEAVFISGGSKQFQPRQIVEYRPSDGTARVLPVQVGAFYGLAAT